MAYAPGRRRELAAWWTERVLAIDGTKLTTHPGDKDPRSRVLCRFVIPDPADIGYLDRRDELRIEHDSDDRIILRCVRADVDDGSRLVATIACEREIEDLVRLVKNAYVRREAEARKWRMIHAMKATAVRAQIAKWAIDSSQRVATSTGTDGIDVFVELTPSRIATFQVKFERFSDTAKTLAVCIADLNQRFAAGDLHVLQTRNDLPEGVDWITA